MVWHEPSRHQDLRLGMPRFACTTRNASACLYYRDPRTRGEARETTWIHQPVPETRARKNLAWSTVKVHRASAPSSASLLAARPGDHPRILGVSAATSSATRAGETGSSASLVPVPNVF